jgi:hypothetical protein
VVRRVIQAAIDGDMVAARLVFDRILPKNRPRRPLELVIPALKSAADVCDALSKIAGAVFEGHSSTSEAAELASLVENYRKALDSASLEQRIVALEQRLSETGV